MEDGKKADADDDRPPICPACGVTMGITVDEDGSTRYVCLECGFSDDPSSCESPTASFAVAVLAGCREGDGDLLARRLVWIVL